ncbi:hypothetical protein [uncultured Rikenella sp.]|uniref:hypothetical protein n=1 Tax=uncultured Rikenella sp. TaxID=368003 RepID=UPI0025E0A389|nr:hypothetical protein [uncultured Rikenella sp.]
MRYPAPGHRGFGEGVLWYVGDVGYSWSSTVNGSDGYFLWFNAQNIDSCRANRCGLGLQLRCLSE